MMLNWGEPARAAGDINAHQTRLTIAASQKGKLSKAAKSVCFLMMGAKRGLLEKEAIISLTELETEYDALLHGDPGRGLEAETDPEIIKQISRLQEASKTTTLSSRQIIVGDWHPVVVGQFLRGNGQADIKLDVVTQAIRNQHLSRNAMAQPVVFVQNQTSILQSMLRDSCLLRVGILSAWGRHSLRAQMELFETNMDALLHGNADLSIPEPPNLSLRVTLEKIQKQWGRVKPVVEKAIQGEDITLKEFQKASIFADLIEKYVGKATGYYWKG